MNHLFSRAVRATLLCALILPACVGTARGYEVDTTRVREPEPRRLNFGQKLLRAPGQVVRIPVYALDGMVNVVLNDIVLTDALGRFSSVFSGVDRVWGFFPVAGYGSNSGLKGGFSFTSKQVFTRGERLKIKATYSTHDYQRYSLRYSAPNKFGPFKRPYIFFSYRKRPWESFYGLGNGSRRGDEVAFTLEKSEFALGWHHMLYTGTRLNIDGGYGAYNLYNGQNPDVEHDLSTIADSLKLTPEDIRPSRVFSLGVGLQHDWRDHLGQPSRGGLEYAGVAYYRGRGRSEDLEYIVSKVDVRHYLNIYKKRLLVLRVMAASVDPVGDSPEVPFYLREYLGGEEDLRGYRTRRFMDNGLALASIEYRWPVWLRADAFLFLDEARVFHHLVDDFTTHDWRYSAGGGLRIWNDGGLALSTTVAFGDEGTRFYLQMAEGL